MTGLELLRTTDTTVEEIADIISEHCPPVTPGSCDQLSCRACWLAWLTAGEPPKEKGPSDKRTAPGEEGLHPTSPSTCEWRGGPSAKPSKSSIGLLDMNLGHNVHILLKTAKQELLEFLTVENAILSEKINERPKFRGVCEPLLKHSIGKVVAGSQLEIIHHSHPLSGPAGPSSIIQDGSGDEKSAAGTRKMRKRGPGARAGGET